MLQDLRFGIRMLAKNKNYTLLAVMTLALGIGANTAIFSVVSAVLIRSLPYDKPQELVSLYVKPDSAPAEVRLPFKPVEYLNLQASSTALTNVAALNNKGWPANLTNEGEAERLQGFQVSSNLFSLLGVRPEIGRDFTAEEDHAGSNQVVMLSHDLWQRRFGGDRGVLGKSLTLNGKTYTVIGVLPSDFRFYSKTDLWTTLGFDTKEANEREARYLELIGRLKTGATIEQAASDTDRIYRAFDNNPNSDLHVRVAAPQSLLTSEVRPLLFLLSAAVAFVLLIACVNMANLTLARGTVRHRELAVRIALGASRARLVRQLLIESALLAIAGGGIGLLASNWAIKFLAAGLPEYLADTNSHVSLLGVDSTALLFTVGLSLVTTLLFGLVPALQLTRVDLNKQLKQGGRTAISRNRFRSFLVVTEVTLAMVTLVGAGLMVKSLWRLVHVNPGYDPGGVLTAEVDPSGERYEKEDQVNAFYKGLLERVASIPGVGSVGIKNTLNASTNVTVAEHPANAGDEGLSVQMNQVSADYFRTIGIPLRSGRFLSDRDLKEAPPVIVVDDSLARQLFPGENPVGKHLNFWKKSWEIVGVVGGARYWTFTQEPFAQMYFSYHQVNWRSMGLVVRSETGDPMRLAGSIRNELAAIDRNQPIHSFKSLRETTTELVAPQKFTTLLLASFAVLSALLSAIGIYGVISYSVSQSTREIGVRMALGAPLRSVLTLVIRSGMTLAVIGVVLGLSSSYWLTRLMTTLLFEVKPTDGLTFAAVAIGLLLVALVACYIPARRATKVSPLVALRSE